MLTRKYNTVSGSMRQSGLEFLFSNAFHILSILMAELMLITCTVISL